MKKTTRSQLRKGDRPWGWVRYSSNQNYNLSVDGQEHHTRRTERDECAQLREALSFSSGRKWCDLAEEVSVLTYGIQAKRRIIRKVSVTPNCPSEFRLERGNEDYGAQTLVCSVGESFRALVVRGWLA